MFDGGVVSIYLPKVTKEGKHLSGSSNLGKPHFSVVAGRWWLTKIHFNSSLLGGVTLLAHLIRVIVFRSIVVVAPLHVALISISDVPENLRS